MQKMPEAAKKAQKMISTFSECACLLENLQDEDRNKVLRALINLYWVASFPTKRKLKALKKQMRPSRKQP